MTLRARCLCLLCLVLCTQAGRGAEPTPAARRFWERGQAAMHLGDIDAAIACYQRSLAEDPQFIRNHLSLAAAYLEKADQLSACGELAHYLDACPNQASVRAHYGELLLRMGRLPESRRQFERSLNDADEPARVPSSLLLQCHCKLVEIAETVEDEYAGHLHRGIGLYLLACERATLEEPSGELPVEGLLCRAAGELNEAHMRRPEEARPCWYLYQVWTRLAQRQTALRNLRLAETAALFSPLTPAEMRALRSATLLPEADPLRR